MLQILFLRAARSWCMLHEKSRNFFGQKMTHLVHERQRGGIFEMLLSRAQARLPTIFTCKTK